MPVPALQHGAASHGFRLELRYLNQDLQVVGEATEKEDRPYDLILEKPPAEEGVPEHLIEEFSLNEIYIASQE